MKTTSAEKKQTLANIVEQQKKLRELALANGIDEVIVNMGATANANELYEIMYPNDVEEDDESEIDEEEKEEHKAIFKHLIKMKSIEFNLEKDLSNIK
jgi:hypothetical protein